MHLTQRLRQLSALTIAAVCVIGDLAPAQVTDDAPLRVTVDIDATNIERTMRDHRLLAGSNIAAWNAVGEIESPEARQLLRDMRIGIIRMPGGSWSDIFFWNGNGVRKPDGTIDRTAVGPDGWPRIDYSAYAPSFLVEDHKRTPRPDGWHGNVDAKALHEFIRDVGAQTLVCVNAGTGRPLDAAEWVRWANKTQGYDVRYWEIGNELDGAWESGHFLPDGSELTAEMYARRYAEFARAMKAVDPTIKIGGAAGGYGNNTFTEAILRECGDLVDFVSIHVYPGNGTIPDAERYARATVATEGAATVRAWARKYQPARADAIEVMFTEWNMVDPATPLASDLFGALWSSVFLTELARGGSEAAMLWDVMTHSPQTGYSLLVMRPKTVPRGQYHALAMWNKFAGNRVLATKADGDAALVRSFATGADRGVSLMLINTDRDRPATASVRVRNFDAADTGETATLSSREYFWNHLTHQPDWSNGPTVAAVKVGGTFDVIVPPYSVTYVSVPDRAAAAAAAAQANVGGATDPAVGPPELRVLVQKDVYAGDRVSGWVQAVVAGTDKPYPKPLPPATLSVSGGAATLERPTARLAEAVGTFAITATEPGTVTVTASLEQPVKASASAQVVAKASVPKPRTFWDFERPTLGTDDGYFTDFRLTSDMSVRAASRVAKVELPADGFVTTDKQRLLLRLGKMPPADQLELANIRGVTFDLAFGRDFSTADPEAHVQVVVQSPMNWWMPLGTISVREPGKWETHTMTVTDPKHVEAMQQANNVWFILNTKTPAKGSVALDNVGFLVR